MNAVSKFIVLIERRRLPRALAWMLASLALVGSLFSLQGAHAQTASSKIAADLQQVISAPTTPKLSWAKDVNGIRYVKVLVISNSTDPDLVALRADVLAKGGAVYFRYVSVAALSAMLPANQVAAIAARSDVQGISPNRLTARTASTLEYATGAMNLRTYSGSSYTGLDGAGVGIAVLDSGMMWNHQNLADAAGRAASSVRWTSRRSATRRWSAPRTGPSASTRRHRCTRAARRWPTTRRRSPTTSATRSTPYGHGTHVASVAAGRGAYQTPDSSGVAPGANLYDVKVLDGNGFGQMSDVLAGIDWVIYHAKEYNIRVMNLSLAADSTETWQTDPLARAARSAVAAGITVVVAAGNFGQSASGAERFGTVSSPGHDPSVITVGSANTKGTAARSDDTRQPVQLARPDPRFVHRRAPACARSTTCSSPTSSRRATRSSVRMQTDKAGGLLNYLAATYPVLSQNSTAKSNVGKIADDPQRHVDRRPGRVRHGGADAAGQPRPDAAADQGDPAVLGAADRRRQPAAARRRAAQRRRRGQLAKALRTDVKTAVEAGTIAPGRQPAGRRQDHAGGDLDDQRPDLQLEPHRLRRRQPDRQRRRAVHQVPADLGPPPGVGRQGGAPPHGDATGPPRAACRPTPSSSRSSRRRRRTSRW